MPEQELCIADLPESLTGATTTTGPRAADEYDEDVPTTLAVGEGDDDGPTTKAISVPVPRTLASNDPDAVAAFARDLGGPMVYKPLAGGGLCRRVGVRDLRSERLRALAAAPVLFQEEVVGRNIRVYVVGGEIAATFEIVSEAVDYRGAETPGPDDDGE